MFSGLMPREKIFFTLIEQAADNVHEGAQALLALLQDFTDVPAKAQHIKDLEHKGDQLTHEIVERLNKTFITPLDREDIHEIACRLDDILDLIDTAVNRMVLYRVGKPIDDAIAMARVLLKAASIVREAVRALRDPGRVDLLMKSCIDIHTAENEGDRIEQHALAALFEGGMAPLDVIKWKDIIEELEAATDRCEDVANALEGVALKQG